MDLTNLEHLEFYFADNFDTTLFPVLSEHYLLSEDLDRAGQVCEIGLGYDKDSLPGLFLQARVLMARKDLQHAELCLKKIIDLDPSFFNAYLLLAEVQSVLKRSQAILMKCYNAILEMDPGNKRALQAIGKLKKKRSRKPRKKQQAAKAIKPKPKKRAKKTLQKKQVAKKSPPKKRAMRKKPVTAEAVALSELEVSPKLATFTLVAVLKSQKLYEQALEVLATMSSKHGVDKKRIAKEKKIIMDLLKSSGSA